jgi:hypothetical protein
MTKEDIEVHKKEIDKMSHHQMAYLYRFARSGHPYFDKTNELSSYFSKKFQDKGGMTTQISKDIGWES